MTNQTHFTPTHIMHQTGRVDVPVIVNQKRDALWLVTDADGKQYWVGKYNVDDYAMWTNLRNRWA